MQFKHSTKDSHPTTREENKRKEKRPRDKGSEKISRNKSKTINKRAIRTYILIITLNVNGLNAPTKRHGLAEWIQKQDSYVCCIKKMCEKKRCGGGCIYIYTHTMEY